MSASFTRVTTWVTQMATLPPAGPPVSPSGMPVSALMVIASW
jgi:hypothetical protein